MLDVAAEYPELGWLRLVSRAPGWITGCTQNSIGITMPLVRDNLTVVYDDTFKRCIMNCNKDHCGLQGLSLT